MRHWILAVSWVFVFCLASSGANAQTFDAYLCTFAVRGMGGEEAKMAIAVDQQGKAFTYETPAGQSNPVRVPGTLRVMQSGEYLFRFSFTAQGDGRPARATAQVRFPKNGGKSSISLTLMGHYGNPRGNGTCQLKRNAKLP